METLEVTLGGRTYPLTLTPEEVQAVREAATAVEKQISDLKRQYAITDRIDLMAMAALQIAVQSKSKQPPNVTSSGEPGPDWPQGDIDSLLQRIHKALDR
jgi:cell division protein ZapA (FtsZ GTPase activity inhibitor)